MSMDNAIFGAEERVREGFVECPAVSWCKIWYWKKEQTGFRDWLTAMASMRFNEWGIVKANQA